MAIVLIPAYLYDYDRNIKHYTKWTKEHGGRVQARIYPARGSSIPFPYRRYEIEIKMLQASNGNIVPAYLIAKLLTGKDHLLAFSFSSKHILENYFKMEIGEHIPLNDKRFDSHFKVFASAADTAADLFTAEIRPNCCKTS